MRVLVIGGTGHIGSYLTPRLVRDGLDVSVTARSPEPKYAVSAMGWDNVTWILCDRREEEKTSAWAERMAAIEVDAVIDLIAYTPEQNAVMVDAFRGRVEHFINCGSIWAYGPSLRVPHLEHYPREPQSDYGKLKTEVENELMSLYRRESFPATVIHPGHISGKRWLPRGYCFRQPHFDAYRANLRIERQDDWSGIGRKTNGVILATNYTGQADTQLILLQL